MTSLKAGALRAATPKTRRVYDRLYALYRQLHDAFGGVNKSADLSGVMKDLIDTRRKHASRPRCGRACRPPYEKPPALRNLVRHRQPAPLRRRGRCEQVAANSQKIVAALNASGALPLKLVFKPILTRPEEIRALCLEANAAPRLRRAGPVDAHVLALEDVDRRPARP